MTGIPRERGGGGERGKREREMEKTGAREQEGDMYTQNTEGHVHYCCVSLKTRASSRLARCERRRGAGPAEGGRESGTPLPAPRAPPINHPDPLTAALSLSL